MRINIISPRLLMNQHLIAEYREIKMLPKSLVRSIKSKKGFDKKRISKTYTLNEGHAYFFYNKLTFIENRFEDLLNEMRRRRFVTNSTNLYDPDFDYSLITKKFRRDYNPTSKEMKVNIERINEKIEMKPTFYKHSNKIKIR